MRPVDTFLGLFPVKGLEFMTRTEKDAHYAEQARDALDRSKNPAERTDAELAAAIKRRDTAAPGGAHGPVCECRGCIG